jgi:hypothetical protein
MFLPAFYSFFLGGTFGTYLSLNFSVRARALSSLIVREYASDDQADVSFCYRPSRCRLRQIDPGPEEVVPEDPSLDLHCVLGNPSRCCACLGRYRDREAAGSPHQLRLRNVSSRQYPTDD